MKDNECGIGVVVVDNIIGFYIDVIGGLLVVNDEIDLYMFVDDDGQVYFYWGNLSFWCVEFNDDMILMKNELILFNMMKEIFGFCCDFDFDRLLLYEEGFWIYK